jgi:hypothetical protein
VTDGQELRPRQPIRRFDVFAETKRREAIAHGEPNDVAKGYGVWVAKVVAARRFGGAKKAPGEKKAERETPTGDRFRGEGGSKFHTLDGVPQTDETFDHDVADRMGREFYEQVFSPAVGEALATGRKYEAFRDSIRKDWKPARS